MQLRRAAVIVEGDDPISRTGEVCHYKAETRIEFARTPLDLGDDAAGLGLTGRLAAEVRIVSAHILRRPADRALQEVGDVTLEDCVHRQSDRMAEVFGCKELMNVRQGEAALSGAGLARHR